MTKLTTVEEIVDEMDRIYGVDEPDDTRTIISGNAMHDVPIEDWLRHHLTTLLAGIREEAVIIRKDLERNDNSAVNTDPAVAFNHGWNAALDEAAAIIQRVIGTDV